MITAAERITFMTCRTIIALAMIALATYCISQGIHYFTLPSQSPEQFQASLLGTAIIEKARTLGARGIYLESNTILKPAISLYHKLGFKKVTGHPTPYARCNIQMGLPLR